MTVMVMIPLDNLTEENGATSVKPGSQVVAEYPTNTKAYRGNNTIITGLLVFHISTLRTEGEARVIAKAGDAVIFTATLQHCAMPNKSKAPRSVLLLQYLAKYVRPMEDQKRMLTKEVHLLMRLPVYLGLHLLNYFCQVEQRASQDMRKLLLLDYPYPAVLDEEVSGNTEGSKSSFKWKY